jgi:uncharacterized protein
VFEYNKKKNVINKKKHGVKLEEAISLWESEHVVIPAKNIDEERFLILGIYNSKVYACIFTLREEKIRLISFHRASKKLERFYYEKIK